MNKNWIVYCVLSYPSVYHLAHSTVPVAVPEVAVRVTVTVTSLADAVAILIP